MSLLNNLANVAEQVAVLLILMAAGVFLAHKKWLGETGVRQITKILINLVTVCVIVKAFLSVPFEPDRLYGLSVAALACVGTVAVGSVLAFLLFRRDEERRSVQRAAIIFSNCGFMGIPLAQALFGDEGVMLTSVYMAVFQLFMWTLGVAIYKVDAGGGESLKKTLLNRKMLLNPGVIGLLVGLPLFFLHISLPTVLYAPIESLALLNTPLAMLVTGYYITKMKIKILPGDGKILFICFLRLVAVPLLLLGGMLLCGVRGLTLYACMVPVCAPSASNTTLFAVEFGGDYIYASRLVSVCTLLSAVTMPLLIALAQTVA